MNKIYKLVWNASIAAWAVVSELTSSKTKAKKASLATAMAMTGLLAMTQQAAAYEAGGGNTNHSCTNYSTTGSKSSQSIAIGSSNTATGPEAGQACAPTDYSIAVGAYSSTAGASGNNQAIAIGYKTTASGDQAIALGANVNASGDSAVAIGGDDIDKAIDSDGAAYTELTGDVLVKMNFVPTTASGAASLALGVQNVASGAFSAAVGSNSKATGLAAVALGTNAFATDKGALAIGAVSNAAASGAIAVGLNTTAAGVNSTAIGSGNTAGAGATTSGDNATAIGSGASASADATAIGTGAKATLAGGVAIGTEAVSVINKGVAGYDPITGLASTAADSTWKSTRAAVSVGDVANGVTRQITGVAAGTADTDVVNVAQLKTIKNYADTIANSTAAALGGGAKLDSTTGSITAPTYNLGGKDYHNVGDALQAAKTKVVEGKNIKVTETQGLNGESIYTVATDKNVTFDTVTVGNVKLDQASNTMTGLSNTDLTAADFATAGRAATEEQVQVVQGNVQNIIGGNTVINADGSITNADIGGTGANNVNDAIKNVNTASKAAKTVVLEGDNIKVSEAKGLDGESIYTVATDKNVNFDTVTVGNVKLDQASNTMTGLSNTDLSAADFATAGRAATEEQVQVVQGNVQNIIGGNTVINPDGSITNADIGGTGANNVNDAIQNVNTASKAAKTKVIKGDNIEVVESLGLDGESIYTVSTARNVHFDSVAVGNVLVSGSSNTMTGLSNKDLSAVDFAQAGRAATEEQLQAVKDELKGAQQAANEGAVKYDKNADGSVNKDSVTFEGKPSTATQDANSGKITSTGGSSLNNVASAGDYTDVNNANKAVNAGDLNNAVLDASQHTADIIGGNTTVNADGSISNNDIGGTGQSTVHDAISSINQAAQAAKAEVKQGDNIVVTESTGSNGQSIYTVSTAKDVTFNSVNAGSINVGNVSITDTGINAGNTQITGVANGAVNSGSQDAINGSQLQASNEQVANALGGGAKFENNQMTAPSYTIGQGDSAQTYHNVGSALDALNKQDQVLGNSIQNLNQGLQDANRRIDDVEKKANAGIAAAMAMETAPFIAGKYTYAVGAAYHGGENAVGATLRKTADNGRWSFTGGVAAGSQGAASVRVGFSGILN